MAQRVRIELTDDLLGDGTPAEETVTFALDGISYEIDLTQENAAKLRDGLASWVAAARRVSGRKTAPRAAGSGRRPRTGAGSAGEIREWARSQGMEVSDRGRVRDDVRAAFEAAHA
ncbi:MAG: Lsr2 family protein [Propionibacteriaceae bacterium]|nr:Lsr2 family protein [Propionibacteriaceae bacterium]